MAESSTTSNGFVIPRSSNLYKPKEEEETPDYASSERYRENERNPMRTNAYDAVIKAGGNPNAARIAAEAVDFVPGVGEAAGAIDVAQSLKSKEYLGAGLNTAALLLGTVPILDVAGKGLRTVAKKLETPKWFKETDKDIDTNVVPIDSQKTQCATTTETYIKARALLPEGNTLDYGAGLGLGAKKIKADTFEPYVRAKKEGKDTFVPTYTDASNIPDNSYKNITNLNVLNAVQPEVRDTIVRHIGRILAPNGNAIITTRGIDVFGTSTSPVIAKLGKEPGSVITSRRTYQKGFTNPELLEYVQNTLGKNFTVSPVELGGAGVKIVKKSIKNKPARTKSIEYIPASPAKSIMLKRGESSQYAGPLEVRSLVIPDKSNYLKKFGNPSSALKKNNLPENIIKDSDNNPIVVYRGLVISKDETVESILSGQSRENYASFFTDNPYMASTYAGAEDSVLTPFFIKPKRIIEFPVHEGRHGRLFDKFEFDIRAKQLKKGEILRAHNVVDAGPRHISDDNDPLDKWSFLSDVYAIKDTDTLVNVYSKKFKKGGTMAKDAQAEMITIGLQDEGGMVDEASGNEVPNGALKEEVRDDQPAMLSPGEFVIPAYAVRYFGVEQFVKMLRAAKQGMEQLDDMGLTGEPNADDASLETATLPTEVDEDVSQFNVGGAVTTTALDNQPTQMSAQQFGVAPPAAIQPAAAPAFGTAPSPLTQQMYRPTAPIRPPGQQNVTYPQFVYSPQGGKGYGVAEYVGPQGQAIFVTTIGGKPISKIPEGFKTRAQYNKDLETDKPAAPPSELQRKPEDIDPGSFEASEGEDAPPAPTTALSLSQAITSAEGKPITAGTLGQALATKGGSVIADLFNSFMSTGALRAQLSKLPITLPKNATKEQLIKIAKEQVDVLEELEPKLEALQKMQGGRAVGKGDEDTYAGTVLEGLVFDKGESAFGDLDVKGAIEQAGTSIDDYNAATQSAVTDDLAAGESADIGDFDFATGQAADATAASEAADYDFGYTAPSGNDSGNGMDGDVVSVAIGGLIKKRKAPAKKGKGLASSK